MTRSRLRVPAILLALVAATVLAGCSGSQPLLPSAEVAASQPVHSPEPPPQSSPTESADRSATPSTPPASAAGEVQSPEPPEPVPTAAATPAPAWLGTRFLGPAGTDAPPQPTPPELLDRRIITVDVLPPPSDTEFRADVSAVPADVLARSTWRPECPVAAADLRYLLVPFWGFDERLHTGEVVLHADAVDTVVSAFAVMHATRFPLEEVRVLRPDELGAAPTGDTNITSVLECRQVTGGSGWSQHSYGRAIDINPFHNPYEKGTGADRVVFPELATAYTDRERVLPGMVTADSALVAAFREAGWGWGGDYRSLKDWQHFSATGG